MKEVPEDEKPIEEKRPTPDLDQPKTDAERIRTKRSGTTQPEEAAVEENVRRGTPRHRE